MINLVALFLARGKTTIFNFLLFQWNKIKKINISKNTHSHVASRNTKIIWIFSGKLARAQTQFKTKPKTSKLYRVLKLNKFPKPNPKPQNQNQTKIILKVTSLNSRKLIGVKKNMKKKIIVADST